MTRGEIYHRLDHSLMETWLIAFGDTIDHTTSIPVMIRDGEYAKAIVAKWIRLFEISLVDYGILLDCDRDTIMDRLVKFIWHEIPASANIVPPTL